VCGGGGGGVAENAQRADPPLDALARSCVLAHAEFSRQVAQERALGLPPSPHMDAPRAAWADMEVAFADYIAGPLWERLAQVGAHAAVWVRGVRGVGAARVPPRPRTAAACMRALHVVAPCCCRH
jgi:hypothetical protein